MLEEEEQIPLTVAQQLRALSFRTAQILDAGAVWIALLTAGTVLFLVVRERTQPSPEISRPVTPAALPGPVEKSGPDFFAEGDYTTAMTCFAESVERADAEEDRLVAIVNRAMAFAKLGRLDRAIDDLKNADELTRRFPELQVWRDQVHLRLAQLCLLAEKPTDAIKHLRLVNSSDTEVQALRTLACLRSGRHYDAVRGASALIGRGMTDAAAYINRAIAFAALDHLELAAADLSRAVTAASLPGQMSPKIRAALAINDAQLALQRRDWPYLVTVCSLEIDRPAGSAKLHRLRAAALAAMGQEQAASIDWKLAAQYDGTLLAETSVRNRVDPFAADDWELPQPQWHDVDSGPFRIVLRLLPNADTRATNETLSDQKNDRVAEAQLLAEAGDTGTAIALLADHLAIVPGDRDARVRRVAMLMDLGDLQAALQDLSLLVSLDPDSPTIHTLRGLALARLGQQDAAVMSFSQVIRLQPDAPDGYFNRGTAYFSQRAWSLASSDFQRAIDRGDESPETRAWQAAAMGRDRRSGAAIREFLAAQKAAPDNPLVHRLYVEWLLETAHPATLDALNAAIEQCPTDRTLRRLRLEYLLTEELFDAALEDARWMLAANPADRNAGTLVRRLEGQTADRQVD